MTILPINNPNPPPKLLDQVRQTMRLKHMSLSTERSYVNSIMNYIFYFKEKHDKFHASELGAFDIRDYLIYLAAAAPNWPTTGD